MDRGSEHLEPNEIRLLRKYSGRVVVCRLSTRSESIDHSSSAGEVFGPRSTVTRKRKGTGIESAPFGFGCVLPQLPRLAALIVQPAETATRWPSAILRIERDGERASVGQDACDVIELRDAAAAEDNQIHRR